MSEPCWCESREPDLTEDIWWSTPDGGRAKYPTAVYRTEPGREHYRVKTPHGTLHHDGAVFEMTAT